MYVVPHFRYGALIWQDTPAKTTLELIKTTYNATFKRALNLPQKSPTKYTEKLLGTWNFDTIVKVSYAANAKKWKQLYGSSIIYEELEDNVDRNM